MDGLPLGGVQRRVERRGRVPPPHRQDHDADQAEQGDPEHRPPVPPVVPRRREVEQLVAAAHAVVSQQPDRDRDERGQPRDDAQREPHDEQVDDGSHQQRDDAVAGAPGGLEQVAGVTAQPFQLGRAGGVGRPPVAGLRSQAAVDAERTTQGERRRDVAAAADREDVGLVAAARRRAAGRRRPARPGGPRGRRRRRGCRHRRRRSPAAADPCAIVIRASGGSRLRARLRRLDRHRPSPACSTRGTAGRRPRPGRRAWPRRPSPTRRTPRRRTRPPRPRDHAGPQRPEPVQRATVVGAGGADQARCSAARTRQTSWVATSSSTRTRMLRLHSSGSSSSSDVVIAPTTLRTAISDQHGRREGRGAGDAVRHARLGAGGRGHLPVVGVHALDADRRGRTRGLPAGRLCCGVFEPEGSTSSPFRPSGRAAALRWCRAQGPATRVCTGRQIA